MRPDWMWLFDAIKNIDYTSNDFMKESFLICRESRGGMTYQDLRDMDYKEYCDTVNYADYLQKLKPEDIDG